MKAFMFKEKIQVLKHASDYIFYNRDKIDVIFICSKEFRTAVEADFDILTYYINPRESVENTIMLKFLGNKYNNFVVIQSELLNIPNIKEIKKTLGDKVALFGILNNPKTKERYVSSYYLERLYADKN